MNMMRNQIYSRFLFLSVVHKCLTYFLSFWCICFYAGSVTAVAGGGASIVIFFLTFDASVKAFECLLYKQIHKIKFDHLFQEICLF